MDLQSLCESVANLMKETGNFIANERENFCLSNVEIKGKNDFVTYVDKTSERLLVEGLSELLPSSGFLTEEGTTKKKGDVYNWIIDPLDGTTNFIHGLPCYAISIALSRNDELIMGLIYEINQDEMFYARENSDAFLNGNKIRVSEVTQLSNALLATGFPYYDYSRMNEYIELFKYYMQHTHGIRRLGSAATDLAYVACGRLDGFYEYGLQPWDVAAGAFILKQAGGLVTDFSGQENYLFGKEIVAGNKNCFGEFLNSIKKHFN